MTFFVGEELLLAELQHVGFLVEDSIFVLVGNFNHLVVLPQNQLRAFDFSGLVEVGQNEEFLECLLAAELSHVRQKHLFAANELDAGGSGRLVVEVHKEFTELDSAVGRACLFRRLLQVILVADLILAHLRAGISSIPSHFVSEP